MQLRRTGPGRYDQLRRLYDNLLTSSAFRQAKGKAKDAVGTGLEQAKDLASEGVQKVKEKRTDSQGASLSVAPPPAH